MVRVNILLKILFIQVLLKLYAKFQPSTMSGSGLKVCGGGGGGGWWWVVVVLRPIIVLSLAQAENIRCAWTVEMATISNDMRYGI